MICDDIRVALSEGEVCEETDRGARVVTHCVYPSFEPVEVFVAKHGHGYVISDGGGAVHAAWLHGRDEVAKVLSRESIRFGVTFNEGAVEARVSSADWLRAGIMAVANASAHGATIALERVAVAAERALADAIYEALARVVSKPNIAAEYEHRGTSGKRWRYDFAAMSNDNLVLVNAVSPHPVSISAKYVAFADTSSDEGHVSKLAVYGRKLETPDVSLITQVATLVPVGSVERGVKKVLHAA